MRLAMIFDLPRLREGGSMLARLCVGLIDEGVHIVRLVPEEHDPRRLDSVERGLSLVPRLDFAAHPPLWLRWARRERLLEALDRLEPDAIYACGSATWSLASQLAEVLDLPLVIEVAGAQEDSLLIRQGFAPKAAAIVSLRGLFDDQGAEPDEAAAAEVQVADPLRPGWIAVNPGVALDPDPPRRLERPAEELSLAILGGCTDLGAWRSVVDALRRLGEVAPGWRGVVELRGELDHEVWRLLRRADLLGRVSSIEDATAVGAMLRRCDAMLVAESPQRVYPPLLEAMASAMPVLCRTDEWLPREDPAAARSLRIEPRRATGAPRGGAVDGHPTADEWSTLLESLVRDPEGARLAGSADRAAIAGRFRTSVQAARLAEFLRSVVATPALPFSGRPG